MGGGEAGESLCWITGQVTGFCGPFGGGRASQGHCGFQACQLRCTETRSGLASGKGKAGTHLGHDCPRDLPGKEFAIRSPARLLSAPGPVRCITEPLRLSSGIILEVCLVHRREELDHANSPRAAVVSPGGPGTVAGCAPSVLSIRMSRAFCLCPGAEKHLHCPQAWKSPITLHEEGGHPGPCPPRGGGAKNVPERQSRPSACPSFGNPGASPCISAAETQSL